ncbi:MAG: CapA family protein [Ruminococcaceae bacterium]|nr:CapA family protein [Oscillospiraceae bacterium]
MALKMKRIKRQGRKAVPAEYRRKRNWKKIAIFAGIGVAVCGIIAVLIVPKLLHGSNPNGPQATTPPPDRVIHFVAGGDLNVTDRAVVAGSSGTGYDYTKVFQDVLPELSRGDITALNFEGVVGGNRYGTDTRTAPAEMLKALSAAGVDVLQTANSYSVYNGLQGLNSTLQGVQDAGLTSLGTYATNGDFNRSGGYVIWEVGGIKVAMMAFTKGMVNVAGQPAGLPDGSEHCVNLLYKDYTSTYQKVNTEGIRQVVRNAMAHQPDVTIAMVHWGSEYNDQISKTQEKICKLLQEEGVDAIVGTHSHRVQEMKFDPEQGTFVAYSLGDFFGGEVSYSVLLDLEITKDGVTGKTKITDFSYVPIFSETDDSGKIRVLRIKEAMAGYENRYLDCVSEQTYLEMKDALTRLESRISGK